MSTSVVFMGTPEFAVPILQSLIDNPEYDVQAVLTQPDHHIGRKRTLHQSPVKELAEQYNIEVLQPAKLSKSPEMEKIISLQPDLMITAAYGQFLPTKLRQLMFTVHYCQNIVEGLQFNIPLLMVIKKPGSPLCTWLRRWMREILFHKGLFRLKTLMIVARCLRSLVC